MIIRVLGSAAGGGVPQWNCNGRNSILARGALSEVVPRSQSSLAVSADGKTWVLLNASPDLRQQIAETPALHPNAAGPLRNSPIAAVVLTNADIDHIAGLLTLREGHAFVVYGSERVQSTLAANSVFNVLAPDLVKRVALILDHPTVISSPQGKIGLDVRAFAVPGKVALFLESGSQADFGTADGDTIGLEVRAGDRSFIYLPACARVDASLAKRLRGAELVFFDGTLFTDDEMISQGLSQKTGKRMGHISMSGPEGSMAALADLDIKRKVYIHINNSNPVLREGSPERAQVEAAGWDVAYDGMEIRL